MSIKVALFATCIVDMLRPEIGFASLALLEAAGCEVSVPEQACCGQPNFNNGDDQGARDLASLWLGQFEKYDYVVIPSGSCAAMLKRHAADLFEDDPVLQARMQALSERCYELSEFLSSVVSPRFVDLPAVRVCYHDSCSGLRELGIKEKPRALLANIKSLSLNELSNAEACCGFGGTFCIKHPEISCHLADDKIAAIENTGVEMLLGGDWGCLMHLQGRIEARGKSIEVKHFSEILAQAIKQEKN
jgi:L-lactate dehydrogenase complex protein LldE